MSTPYATPQPLSPLLYKGVFSTRNRAKNTSMFNHAHDVLHHIQFLGIGTYDGKVQGDILTATYLDLHQAGLSGSETYRLAKDKYLDSLVSEGIEGNARLQQIQLDSVDSIESLIGDLISFKESLLQEIQFAKILNSVDVLEDVITKRLNEIKDGVIENRAQTSEKDVDAVLKMLEDMKRLFGEGKEVNEPLVVVDRVKTKKKSYEAMIQEVSHALGTGFDEEAIPMQEMLWIPVPRDIDKLEYEVAAKALCKVSMVQFIDSIKSAKETQLEYEDIQMDRLFTDMATIRLEKIVGGKVKTGDVMAFSWELMDKVAKETHIQRQLLSSIEDRVVESIKDITDEFQFKSLPRQFGLVHYIMMYDDRLYQSLIQDVLEKYLLAHNIKYMALDDLSDTAKLIIEAAVDSDEYEGAKQIVDAITGDFESYNKVVSALTDTLQAWAAKELAGHELMELEGTVEHRLGTEINDRILGAIREEMNATVDTTLHGKNEPRHLELQESIQMLASTKGSALHEFLTASNFVKEGVESYLVSQKLKLTGEVGYSFEMSNFSKEALIEEINQARNDHRRADYLNAFMGDKTGAAHLAEDILASNFSTVGDILESDLIMGLTRHMDVLVTDIGETQTIRFKDAVVKLIEAVVPNEEAVVHDHLEMSGFDVEAYIENTVTTSLLREGEQLETVMAHGVVWSALRAALQDVDKSDRVSQSMDKLHTATVTLAAVMEKTDLPFSSDLLRAKIDAVYGDIHEGLDRVIEGEKKHTGAILDTWISRMVEELTVVTEDILMTREIVKDALIPTIMDMVSEKVAKETDPMHLEVATVIKEALDKSGYSLGDDIHYDGTANVIHTDHDIVKDDHEFIIDTFQMYVNKALKDSGLDEQVVTAIKMVHDMEIDDIGSGERPVKEAVAYMVGSDAVTKVAYDVDEDSIRLVGATRDVKEMQEDGYTVSITTKASGDVEVDGYGIGDSSKASGQAYMEDYGTGISIKSARETEVGDDVTGTLIQDNNEGVVNESMDMTKSRIVSDGGDTSLLLGSKTRLDSSGGDTLYSLGIKHTVTQTLEDTELLIHSISLPIKAVVGMALQTMEKYRNVLTSEDVIDSVEAIEDAFNPGLVEYAKMYESVRPYREAVDEALLGFAGQLKIKDADVVIAAHESFTRQLTDAIVEDGLLLEDVVDEMVVEFQEEAQALVKRLEQVTYGTPAIRIDVKQAQFDSDFELKDAEGIAMDAVLEHIHDGMERVMYEAAEDTTVAALPQVKSNTMVGESYAMEEDTPREFTVGGAEMADESVSRYGEIDETYQGKDVFNNPAVVMDGVKANEVFGDEGIVMMGTHAEQVFDSNHGTENRDYVPAQKIIKHDARIDLEPEQGELGNSSEEVTYHTEPDTDIRAELVGGSDEPITFPGLDEPILGELTSSETDHVPVLDTQGELFGELTSSEQPIRPSLPEPEFFGLLMNTKAAEVKYGDQWGERDDNQGDTSFLTLISKVTRSLDQGGAMVNTKVDGYRTPRADGDLDETEHEVAVFACKEPSLKLRKRPNLEPDPQPEEPEWEWSEGEGFQCDDWLIVPLKDFNYDAEPGEFFDDNFQPLYPTGQEDEDGNPYVMPPYTILNEPISNGADVGGKEPMFINPRNLYSAMKYVIGIYDNQKGRFRASDPVSVMSRVMNMLYEKITEINAAWTPESGYTPDEMWRVYRFIRWMAIGAVNRFYRLKVEYVWGDYTENFDAQDMSFDQTIRTSGAAVRVAFPYGQVLDGHPMLDIDQNWAEFPFALPDHLEGTTLSFEMGGSLAEREKEIAGAYDWVENFEGTPKVTGTGWVKVPGAQGKGLGIEHPAQAKVYKTEPFYVPVDIVQPITLYFDYLQQANMNAPLKLFRDGVHIWTNDAREGHYHTSNAQPGEYHFEVDVPEAEDAPIQPILFPAVDIQYGWRKGNYQTTWEVQGEYIYEEANTGGYAMVYNEAWLGSSEYEFSGALATIDPDPHGAQDFLGYIFNVKDDMNYYVAGIWADWDKNGIEDGNFCGVWKVENGNHNVCQYGEPLFRFGDGNTKYDFHQWYDVEIKVNGNTFDVTFDGMHETFTDDEGWGYGSCGMVAYSNPYSAFRDVRYAGKPSIRNYIDNIKIHSPGELVEPEYPEYQIDFYLDNMEVPKIKDFSEQGKYAYSFPILNGEHTAKWVFKKKGNQRMKPGDFSFIDNIVVKDIKIIDANVVEEFLGCGGHMGVKILIEGLLLYYRKHHQGCKGRRDIWIVE